MSPTGSLGHVEGCSRESLKRRPREQTLMNPDRYVAVETVKFQLEPTARNPKPGTIELLWGDGVWFLDGGTIVDGKVRVRARGMPGTIPAAALGNTPLLELYFIDVGQGDGVLIITPDRRHIMIDGGYKRAAQPTGKNAADFVDWKFARDYQAEAITLEAIISSHCDADHYGGLWDLINPAETRELDLTTVRVGKFYHAGVGWWTNGQPRNRTLGGESGGFLTRLVGNRVSLGEALRGTTELRLQGEWAEFMKCVHDLGCDVERLSDRTGHLPGFSPAASDVAIRVLGPVEFRQGNKPVLRDLGSPSTNTNGHSVFLRLDYGHARIQLTGDLNAASQKILLEQYSGAPDELACDVAKACHHGSDDCSVRFLELLNAGATVISSGDNEAHAHPRASIVAASALTGHRQIVRDKVVTPLIYSTEIARSVRLGKAIALEPQGGDPQPLTPENSPRVHYLETGAGDLRARRGSRSMHEAYIVAGIVYGLVNVRTDGETILCATMNEKSGTWDARRFKARF